MTSLHRFQAPNKPVRKPNLADGILGQSTPNLPRHPQTIVRIEGLDLIVWKVDGQIRAVEGLVLKQPLVPAGLSYPGSKFAFSYINSHGQSIETPCVAVNPNDFLHYKKAYNDAHPKNEFGNLLA